MTTANDPLNALDLAQTLARLAQGTATSQALTAASLSAIERDDANLRACTFVDTDAAFEMARKADERRERGTPLSRFDGLPVAIKANIAVAGWPHTAGMQLFHDRIAPHDAPVVARLRALGAVLVASTNMDEAALGASTMNPWFGTTQNPRKPGHSTGGSSGGSAAAVAAGYVSLALGTDTIGSVRIPASYCGVSALKPTHGLVSIRDVEPVHERFDHVGPIARGVAHLGELAAALAAYDRASPTSFPIELNAPQPAGSRVRVGVPSDLDSLGVTAEVRHAFEAAIETLRSGGHTIVPVDTAAWDLVRVRRAVFALCELHLWRHHRAHLAVLREEFSPGLLALLDYGASLKGPDVLRFETRIAQFYGTMLEAFDTIDVLATPTTPHTAFAHDGPIPPDGAELTSIASATGFPAIAMPLPAPAGLLPASLQLIGAANADLEIARIASDLERSFSASR